MHTFHMNLLKAGILFWIPVLMLTACTGKNDIVLELETTETVQEETAEQPEDTKEQEVLPEPDSGEDAREQESAVSESSPSEIYVHIGGAVVNPGVYVLAPDSRVFEGVAAAGGFREDACEDFINQAMPLQDGQRLIVPTEEEVQAAKEDGTYTDQWTADVSDTAGNAADGGNVEANAEAKVNINTATEEELSKIPGIGAGKAAAIIQYRQENGAFASKEDIMKVSGIKEGTYEKIKDKITVN